MNMLEKIAVGLGIGLSAVIIVVAAVVIIGNFLQSDLPRQDEQSALEASPEKDPVQPDKTVAPRPTTGSRPHTATPPKTEPAKPPDAKTIPPQPPQPHEYKGNSGIKGKIVKQDGPASDILVEVSLFERNLNEITPKVIGTASTGADGTFEVTGIVPAKVSVVARRKGVGMATRQMIELRDGQVKDIGEIKLENSGVKGSVKDDKGNPIPEASVIVEKMVNETPALARKVVIEQSSSDMSGAFSVGPLCDGTYYVRVEKNGYNTQNISIKIGPSSQEFVKAFILRPVKK